MFLLGSGKSQIHLLAILLGNHMKKVDFFEGNVRTSSSIFLYEKYIICQASIKQFAYALSFRSQRDSVKLEA